MFLLAALALGQSCPANPTAITGVTAPVAGATPVTSVSGTGYTGTVTWTPAHAPFQTSTAYTANVVVVPSPASIVNNVTNATETCTFTTPCALTVAGATVTAAATSCGTAAVFPATGATVSCTVSTQVNTTSNCTGSVPQGTVCYWTCKALNQSTIPANVYSTCKNDGTWSAAAPTQCTALAGVGGAACGSCATAAALTTSTLPSGAKYESGCLPCSQNTVTRARQALLRRVLAVPAGQNCQAVLDEFTRTQCIQLVTCTCAGAVVTCPTLPASCIGKQSKKGLLGLLGLLGLIPLLLLLLLCICCLLRRKRQRGEMTLVQSGAVAAPPPPVAAPVFAAPPPVPVCGGGVPVCGAGIPQYP